MKLVVDAMGGDLGAKAAVGGILKLLRAVPDLEVIAVGKEDDLEALRGKCRIIPAGETLPMECGALEAMRRKDSSIYKAVDAVIREDADGVVSAGSTGAFLSLASLRLKKIEGVLRPALITPFPTKVKDKWCVLLDVGASSENTAAELAQFAALGAAYVKSVYANEHPSIYLISNGTEEGKGTPLYNEAYKLLKGRPGFKGYIEGRDIFSGQADVVIFDGFTGNVFLKTAEGVAKFMSDLLKEAFMSSFSAKLGYLYARKGIDGLRKKMDYKQVGGALLIGVSRICVKAHGNSDADAFYHSLMLAYGLMKEKTVETIRKNLKNETD